MTDIGKLVAEQARASRQRLNEPEMDLNHPFREQFDDCGGIKAEEKAGELLIEWLIALAAKHGTGMTIDEIMDWHATGLL